MCCFGEQENRDLTQSLLGDQKHVTKVESTAILSGTREVSSGVFSSHTEYQVQLHVTGAVIPSCWKRYSDFEAMHMGMMEQAPHMLAAFSVVLPPKSISNSREAKEMRRQNLEEYLRRVVASASLLYSKDLQDFVGCEPTIVEQMSASATEQQRHIKALWQAQLKVPLAHLPCPAISLVRIFRRKWVASVPPLILSATPTTLAAARHRRSLLAAACRALAAWAWAAALFLT
jgi:hypothetical protein